MILLATYDGRTTMLTGSHKELRQCVTEWGKRCSRWAIYRDNYKGVEFCDPTDANFLVEHDDPYWHRQEEKCQ